MDNHNFRIVVVGGGPVGLVAAHILSQAKLNFVILEKYHSVTPEAGNGVALWPQTMRVMDQLGLFDVLKALSVPLASKICMTQQGQIFNRNKAFSNPKPNHGYSLDFFHRHSFLSALYNGLSDVDKSRIQVDKHVTEISTSGSDGTSPVRVVCADGSIEEADIVIGADGVHSTVRNVMQQDKERKASPPPDASAESQWKTTYCTLLGSISLARLDHLDLSELTPGDLYESHGPGVTTQFFIGIDKAWFFVYSKISIWNALGIQGAKERYTQKDADEYAEKLGHIHLTNKLLLRDVYEHNLAASLTNLQEGVSRRWSWDGRAVLVGDAVHKFTPNIGWGFNSGVHDLVVLVNTLRRLIVQSKEADLNSHEVTTKKLQEVFSSYDKQRMAQASQLCNLSGKYTRISSWNTSYKRFLDLRIFPAIGADDLLVTYALGNHNRKIPVLDWLDEPHLASGSIAWTHGLPGKRGHRKALERFKWRVIDCVMPAVIALL